MNIKNIINSYLGNKQVNRIYQGFKLVWIKYFGNRYMIGGNFTSYSPNVNLLDDYKNSISIVGTYNQTNYEYPPLNGLTTNIVATIDNSTQIDPEFAVTKINRLNSGVNQADYLELPSFQIEPRKTMVIGFWYYGTYGTTIKLYSQDTETRLERWYAPNDGYIVNTSNVCSIPVTTNTWQYIQVRSINTHTTLNKQSAQWLVLHSNQENISLSNTEYWKITCVKSWYVESITKNKIIRLNNDDSVDDTWYNNSSYTSGAFYQLIYDNVNKKIYGAGGSALDGGLVRFNNDGTKDTSFDIGTGFNNTVTTLNLDTINQKLYVGGGFTTYKGNTQNRIVRLNLDGSLDTSFNIGTGFDNTVRNIIIDNINSKIYVGGDFITFNGNTQNRLVRLNMDGSKDISFDVGTGFSSSVYTLNLDTINQKLYVGGYFTTFNGGTQNKLIRLNLDGTKDISFDVGTGFSSYIYALNLDTINQKLYVGGSFTTYNGNTQNRLIRLNMDGSKDTSFDVGTGFSSSVYTLNIDTINKKIYVGGAFNSYNGTNKTKLIRLNMDGLLDNTFNIGISSDVRTILKYTE